MFQRFTLLLFISLGLCPALQQAKAAFKPVNSGDTKPKAGTGYSERLTNAFANAPLLFIENRGQVLNPKGKPMPEVLFTAKSGAAEVQVLKNCIRYIFTKVDKGQVAIPGNKSLVNAENNGTQAGMPLSAEDVKNIKVSTSEFTLRLAGAAANASVSSEKQNAYYENHYTANSNAGILAHSYERIRISEVYPGINWVIVPS
ncbi:MAG: hypothetical protein V4543_09845 [Bacteroidota bacterium]